MSLLALSNQELQDKVLEELAENPALEMLEDLVCPTCKKRLPTHGPCPRCSTPRNDEDSVVFISPRHSGDAPRFEEEGEELEPAAPESLAVHVLEQIAADLKNEDRAIAAYILSSLDDADSLLDSGMRLNAFIVYEGRAIGSPLAFTEPAYAPGSYAWLDEGGDVPYLQHREWAHRVYLAPTARGY